MKRILAIIPALLICFSLVMCLPSSAASSSIDYEEWYKSVDDLEELVPGVSDFHWYLNYAWETYDGIIGINERCTSWGVSSAYPDYDKFETYFYKIYMSQNDYNKMIAGNSFTFTCYFTELDSILGLEPVTSSDSFVFYDCLFYSWANFTYNPSTCSITYSNHTLNAAFPGTGSVCYFGIDLVSLNTAQYQHSPGTRVNVDYRTFSNDCFANLLIDTNIPDFPLDDLACIPDKTSLNVLVTMDPVLSGDFSRTVTVGTNTTTIDTLSFTVSNRGKTNIQYSMFIISDSDLPNLDFYWIGADNDFIKSGRGFRGSPSFAYVTDEWYYLPQIDSNPFPNASDIKTYGPCSWHYLASGDTVTCRVSFTQMNLQKGVQYHAIFYAVPVGVDGKLDCCTVSPNNGFYGGALHPYRSDLLSVVYDSVFNITNPAVFDRTVSSLSGVYTYDPDDPDLFRKASGYVDDNGKINIGKYDTDEMYKKPNAYPSASNWDFYSGSKTSVSDDLSSLSLNVSTFFKFFNAVWNYFPKSYSQCISLGLISIITLGILKVVFR